MSLQPISPSSQGSHETLGTHVLLDLSGCPFNRLNDPQMMDQIFTRAIELAGATLIHKFSHKFEPHGVTMFYALAESHLTIHSWPENGFASVDMYTCGKCDPIVATDHIRRELESTFWRQKIVDRGIPESTEPYYHVMLERS